MSIQFRALHINQVVSHDADVVILACVDEPASCQEQKTYKPVIRPVSQEIISARLSQGASA
jgi:hypothetical protein